MVEVGRSAVTLSDDQRPIVVGIDESAESLEAVILAARLAKAANARLLVVGATHDPLAEVAAARLRIDPAAYHEALLAETRSRLTAGLSSVLEPAALNGGLVIRIGRPEYVLAEFGKEEGAGLFVLGGSVRTVRAEWFQRGTAHHLLRSTDIPVLVTGPGAPAVERILVAVDLSEATRQTIHFAKRLAAWTSASLAAIHVLVPTTAAVGAVLGIDGAANVVAAIRQRIETEVWPLLDAADDRRILEGVPAETIARVAGDGPATVLVVGSHGFGRVARWLLGSTAEALLASLPCSIAVVPDASDG